MLRSRSLRPSTATVAALGLIACCTSCSNMFRGYDYQFHGRVVDQYQQPVAGADVTFEGVNNFLEAGSGIGRVKTDPDGYFVIDVRGAALRLGGIHYPQLEYSYQVPRLPMTDRYVYRDLLTGAAGFQAGGKDRRFQDSLKYFDRAHAYTIRTYRKKGPAGAFGRGAGGFHILSDGRTYTLRFLRESYHGNMLEGAVPGHIRISCARGPIDAVRDDTIGAYRANWAYTITPVNGGILPTTDEFMNEAPESGYQNSYKIAMKRDDPNFVDKLLNQRFYFRSNGGKEYGMLYVHFEPLGGLADKDKPCMLSLRYKLNDTGSRNLEVQR